LRGVKTPVVDIVATKYIGYKDTMDLGFLQHFCKPYPVVDIIELMRMVIRMSPKARRLMAAACNNTPSSATIILTHVMWLNLHISTKALMISFLPGVAVPFLGFAFFEVDVPFSRFLFAMA
jgi:hypothetical protein